jgi:hypothetical protein
MVSSSRSVAAATSRTAASNASSFALDGFRNPLTFRTNCSAAAEISGGAAGASGRLSTFMLRHMGAKD